MSRTNKDLDPVPPARRKWGVVSFIAYWISDAFNAATWQFASAIVAVGLTWRESLGIVALSFFIISWVNTVRVMIGAIWPSFLTLPNHIPVSQGIDTATMISFFIFWLVQLPFVCMHPNQLRFLFMAKTVIVPAAWVAILIWALASTKGHDIFQQRPTVSGSAYSWAFLSSMTSTIGNYATLSVNQADFSRYSRVSVKWQCMYVPMLPMFFTFIAFIGIASALSGGYHWGVVEWDPMALVAHWDNRAARFFAAFSFALAALGVNISANSLSAANDLMALAPQYINLRRGQILTAILCWALVPWKILASAGSFLNFMSAYAIFLGPIAAIMLFDFWVVHNRKYDTIALYNPHGIYRYTYGVNLRAVVAFLVGVAPSLPGFVNGINHNVDVGVGIHPYQFGWLLGFVATALVYTTLSFVFPARETFIEHALRPDEVFAQQGHVVEEDGGAPRVEEIDPEKRGIRQRLEKFL
ncbi:hypothetical protein LTR47_001327 [Exophiala xenobiotica]|nr:hypothetical protein LTR92_010409 [Exophiala xenobiotica]KAK5230192.1 hypothetical protein LTR72_001727 [Exophiala xenobiotica]KAK5238234.1 hypothetical protein LTR47_001327 [Exophiala xenobiotica]KAK5296159.1 hypothetical protein LTR14_003790 [Exophiala xenobiotica]KAK5355987.1 hypothetical protein LTR61_001660 [Exophiala xenobiotica]